MSDPDAFRLFYRLDRDDRIIRVGGDWDDFALANDSPDALGYRIIGRRLDDFITGDATRMFVRTMLNSARLLNRPVYRPYRCDSPTEKRYMEMLVTPDTRDSQLEVRHRTLRVESVQFRLPVMLTAQPDELAPPPAMLPPKAGNLHLKRCSLCNLLQIGERWREAEDAFLAGLLQAQTPVKVFYGVCPRCQEHPGVPL